jgi:hypothetical protein
VVSVGPARGGIGLVCFEEKSEKKKIAELANRDLLNNQPVK